MPLIDDVFQICNNYAGRGWGNFLQQNFGLDITKDNPGDLAAELDRPLNLNRARVAALAGFSDLAINTERAVQPGDPARSLLYHAFSSPGVQLSVNEEDYPTLEELTMLENYVWVASANGANPPTLDDIILHARQKINEADAPLAVVVFAQEYRQGHESSHRRHADVAFSRTGVARIGTEEAHYSRRNRGYWAGVEGAPKSIRTIPAQYAPYIAVRASRGNQQTFGPLSLSDSEFDPQEDANSAFWVPVHKLFKSRDECIRGVDLSELKLEAHHVNQKLRNIHEQLHRLHFPAEDNLEALNKSPYFITDEMIATVSPLGQVVPKAQPLVAVARDEHGQRITFQVPHTYPDGESNRPLTFDSARIEDQNVFRLFDRTTMEFTAPDDARKAPEYLHIRRRDGDGNLLNEDMNSDPNISQDPRALVGTAGHPRRAVHYMDFTGDGWVTVAGLPPLNDTIKNILPAFSIVSAPDFYPLVSQYELERWLKNNPERRPATWERIPPNVLSASRMAANLRLRKDDHGNPVVFGESHPVFEQQDRTLTAIVSLPIRRTGLRIPLALSVNPSEVKRQPILPDSAAGVFAPGWDVSKDITDGVEHLAAYGLGSPFPEDAKLCSALSGFWPAASPDTTITFNVTNAILERPRPIIAPMTDNEIKGDHPWDGVQGPHLIKQIDGKIHAIYPNYYHTDYVVNAENAEFSLVETSNVTTAEYIRRIIVMQKVNKFLKLNALDPRFSLDLSLFSFQAIDNGGGSPKYRFEYAVIDRSTQTHRQPEQGGPRFFEAEVRDRRTIEVTLDGRPVEVMNRLL